MLNNVIAAVSLAIWAYLICARGRFWTNNERDSQEPPAVVAWPSVTAVVPARNEAACVGESIGSLLRQDYQGRLRIILVDDDSNDGTADVARRAATSANGRHQFTVVSGGGLTAGWTGKLWALKRGIDAAEADGAPPYYLLLTDADIMHAPDTLSWLVSKAQSKSLALTSFMAKLRCDSFAERSHVPAFIFFFQMLFPFSWVNREDSATAAAAGGCMLVRADALREAGGIASIRGALIDDCSLGAKMKAQGPIWLGMTERVRSIRPYHTLADIKQMISRSAYAQLRYSPWLLIGTTLGLALTFLAPPLFAIFGAGVARWCGVLAWLLMALALQPMLRFYRRSPLWGLALPAIALAYMLYTIDSAVQYMRGRGGHWKGRVQANVLGR